LWELAPLKNIDKERRKKGRKGAYYDGEYPEIKRDQPKKKKKK